jgi:dual specificity phosphatase 12
MQPCKPLSDASPDSHISYIPTPTIGKLFLGNINSVADAKAFCINYIVSMIPTRIQSNVEKHEIYGLYDDARPETLERMNNILNTVCHEIYAALMQGKNVLVHCHAGISRSSTVVIDCLLTYFPTMFKGDNGAHIPYTSITISNAIYYVQKYRPIVEPNEGFTKLLFARHLGRIT